MLPPGRIPGPDAHKEIWVPTCAPYPDDGVVNRLCVHHGPSRSSPPSQLTPVVSAWAQAWITNRASFYVTRALIGACEGGFIPGTILFATYFYKSRELATRLAIFWSTLNVCTGLHTEVGQLKPHQVARVISALLAAGILQMRGIGGQPGWHWLFLLEGLLTFVIGVIVSTLPCVASFAITDRLAELPLSPTISRCHQKLPLSSPMV
jgi:MFS family permease